MYRKKSMKPPVTVIAVLSLIILCGGFYSVYYFSNEIELCISSAGMSDDFFRNHEPDVFINSMAYDRRNDISDSGGDELCRFNAPEGFKIKSYSQHWDIYKLRLLYNELKQNTYGDEINKLYEIAIYPYENDSSISALATYSPGIAAADFYIRFPAFPDDFRVSFPVFTGRINIYGGDGKTTIESVAGSLSHEYGHHYTFYYMFEYENLQQDMLALSRYALLREAGEYDLITTADIDENYEKERHRYLIEIAAEDYVTLMGSPATRQVQDYYDVKQMLENDELSMDRVSERNAFPQENMSIPLAIDMPGLRDYFFSFIEAAPEEPVEEKQEIAINISRDSQRYSLETGEREFVYYTVTWNTPYQDTIYTLACFDRYDYTGWGYPVKTVRPGNRRMSSASAVVGNYALKRGNVIHSMDDGIAEGIKVFYVTAQLPDGTYYVSELYEFNFG